MPSPAPQTTFSFLTMLRGAFTVQIPCITGVYTLDFHRRTITRGGLGDHVRLSFISPCASPDFNVDVRIAERKSHANMTNIYHDYYLKSMYSEGWDSQVSICF
jgi:hypothetical protein